VHEQHLPVNGLCLDALRFVYPICTIIVNCKD
jgi:hypothetical protein